MDIFLMEEINVYPLTVRSHQQRLPRWTFFPDLRAKVQAVHNLMELEFINVYVIDFSEEKYRKSF